MVEKQLYIDALELNYKGLFNVRDLLDTIDKLVKERGYKKSEKIRQELVKKGSKYLTIELRPTKAMTEYYSLMIKMRITIDNLKEVDVIIDNRKRKMQSGDINIIFDAWTTTDYEFRWEQKAWAWLLRGFFEKIFFRVHTDKYVSILIDDTHYIYNNVKAHLNLHRFITKKSSK